MFSLGISPASPNNIVNSNVIDDHDITPNEGASSAAVFREYVSIFDQFVQENEGKEEFLRQFLSRYRPQLEEVKNCIDRVNAYKRRRLLPTMEELDDIDPLLRFY